MLEVIMFILSIIITVKICNVINQNTIGTTRAYFKRGFIVWIIVFWILVSIWGKIKGIV